jgi:hypothetical protein
MHSALDYIIRTTHSSSKRAQGGSGVARIATTDMRALALQSKADEAQRLCLFDAGVIPHIIDIIELCPASESRQVLEDALQCISNIAYSEVAQRRMGGMRIISVLAARLAADGPSCAEIAIKSARSLSTLFWQSSRALKFAIELQVPAITTQVLAEHIALPFASSKLLSLMADMSHGDGAPQQMTTFGASALLHEIRLQPWFIRAAAIVTPGMKGGKLVRDLERLGK